MSTVVKKSKIAKIPKLNTGIIRRFRSRRSQSSVSSTSDVPASEATSDDRGDLSVS